MRKAKFMLAAIALLGLVAGTLAFKAHKKFVFSLFVATSTIPGHVGTFYCYPAFASTLGTIPIDGPFYQSLALSGALTYYTTVDNRIVYCTFPVSVAYMAAGE